MRTFWIYNLLFSIFFVNKVSGYAYNYHFMEETCDRHGVIVDLTEETSVYGFINLVRDGGYSPNLDCKMEILAPADYRITARLHEIEIYTVENCSSDYVQIDDGKRAYRICGYGSPSYVYTTVNRTLGVEFHSGDWSFENDRMGFELYYTAFHEDECDTKHEFECDVGDRCIPRELTCDNYDNCGDWSDERASLCGIGTASIVAISVTTVLCCGVCLAAAVYYCIDNRKRNRRRATRRQNQNVEYTREQNTADENAPPPYSSYFTTPPYTPRADDKDLPPAYSNLGFDQDATPSAEATSGTSQTQVSPTDATQSSDTNESVNVGSTYDTIESSITEPTNNVTRSSNNQNQETDGTNCDSSNQVPNQTYEAVNNSNEVTDATNEPVDTTSQSTEATTLSSASGRSLVLTPPTGGRRNGDRKP